MTHPLEFVPMQYRLRCFLLFLALTIIIFLIFRVLDEPLHTEAAPNGIVSLELAGSAEQSALIVSSWRPCGSGFPDDTISCDSTPLLYAAFGLGLDYLFMPAYALALAFGILLATQRHGSILKYIGALAGYGSFAAALFDVVENFALWQILLGAFQSGYPDIAAFCARIKFGLLIFGSLAVLVAWILPKK